MIQTFDCRKDYLRYKDEIDAAIGRVLDSGQVILGPEVEEFEREFAGYVGASFGVGVKSGTDALIIALTALEVGRGDEVITVANTAVPTVAAIRAVGAIPKFVDVRPDDLLIDPELIAAAIGPRTKCIIPVHLYGCPTDMPPIMDIARRNRLSVIADCAHAHGARLDGQHVGTFADIGCFSFYPTKNLGAFGDGGLCVSMDDRLAARMRQIRMFGFDANRIAHCEGLCSRLDELQAAILRVKLHKLDEVVEGRRRLAQCYTNRLQGSTYRLPVERGGVRHAYHQYVIRTPVRSRIMQGLDSAGIGYGIHYPHPIHLMPAYEFLGYHCGDLPVTESAAQEVLSLPLHPGLTESDVEKVAEVLLAHESAAA